MSEDSNNKKHLPASTIDRFLDVQEKELSLKEKELECSRKSQEYSHEYALKSLEAHAKDRECARQHESNTTKFRYLFASIIIVGLFVLFGIAISYGKDQIVMEIIKAIAFLGAGGLGGYSLGKRNNSTNNMED